MKLSSAPRLYALAAIGVAVLTAGGLMTLPGAGQANAQRQPTIVLAPSSGPCDAPLEVRGRGFEPQDRPGRELLFYVLQPSAADVSMGTVGSAWPDGEGAFSEWVGMREHGCEAAALDSEAEAPSGHVVIAVAPRVSDFPTGEGERIPDIIATARYEYTTTAPPPQPIMVLSPSKGPCDAVVDITGRDFPPSTAIRLDVARPGEGTLGKLVSLVTDPVGTFSVTLELGSLGCEAAVAVERLGEGPDTLGIRADLEEQIISGPPAGIPPILTQAPYVYTTTAVSPEALPATLPQTGSGPGASSGPSGWLVLIAPLAGLGLVLVMASLYLRRKRT